MERLINKFLTHDEVSIDGFLFKLHYKVTVYFLFGLFILISSRQYFGKPIECIPSKSLSSDLLNSYCWITGNFTEASRESQDNIYYGYYQWTFLFLLTQIILFYLPHFIWRNYEGQLIQHLITTSKTENLRIFARHSFACVYLSCLVMGILNSGTQIIILKKFFGTNLTLSKLPKVLLNGSLGEYFPKMVKCNFSFYGPSGDVETFKTLCILPLNVFIEKIYPFLSFWYLILSKTGIFDLIYHVLLPSDYFLKFNKNLSLKYCILLNLIRKKYVQI